MIDVLEHPLVAGYLRDLDAALACLPAAAAAELSEQLRAHLLEALPPDAHEDTVMAVLAALGPARLVAEAAAGPASGPGRSRARPDPPLRRMAAWARRQPARTWLAIAAATITIGLPAGTLIFWQAQPRLQWVGSFSWWSRADGARAVITRADGASSLAKKIGPHTLRHAFITAALDAGVPLRDVQEAASHADPAHHHPVRPGPGVAGSACHPHRRCLHRRSRPVTRRTGRHRLASHRSGRHAFIGLLAPPGTGRRLSWTLSTERAQRAAVAGLEHTQRRRHRRPPHPPLRPEESGAMTDMQTYAFRVRLRDAMTDSDADRLHEALDDEVGVEDGPRGHFIGFERQAESFLDAVLNALAKVMELGFEPLAVEDELVSISDIAERTGRSRQSVSMLVNGQRGLGNFPRPAAGNVRSPLWHWADVAAWFGDQGADPLTFEDRLQAIASINGALANRVLARIRPADVRRIQERLAG